MPHYFSANVLSYEFTPLAECPKWLTLWNRNLEGDQERIALLQQYYGYYLTPTLSAQKFIPPTGIEPVTLRLGNECSIP